VQSIHFVDDDPDREGAVMRFDLVDADWLDDQADHDNPLFRFDAPEQTSRAWRAWFANRREVRDNAEDPFEGAPLAVFETKLPFGLRNWQANVRIPRRGGNDDNGNGNDDWRDDDLELTAAYRELWFELTKGDADYTSDGGTPLSGLLYRSFFDEGIRATYTAQPVASALATSLNAISGISGSPDIDQQSLDSLAASVRADLLAVYDVGQANANALLGLDDLSYQANSNPTACPVYPTLYFDLGMPVQSMSKTAPAIVRFCFSQNPLIVLSHWHDDHLSGAALPVNPGRPNAFNQTWIVPDHPFTIKQKAMVTSIWTQGGAVHVFPTSSTPAIFSTTTGAGDTLTLTRGTAKDPNCGGIIMTVARPDRRPGAAAFQRLSWLLPGDCDYKYFPSGLNTSDVVAVVAPHHGGRVKKHSTVVASTHPAYQRLIYSFGRNNTYPHPHQTFLDDHHVAGWIHPMTTGSPTPEASNGSDVRTTNTNLPLAAHPEGVAVGWTQAAPMVMPACKWTGMKWSCLIPLSKP
jgi:hypothetical protein